MTVLGPAIVKEQVAAKGMVIVQELLAVPELGAVLGLVSEWFVDIQV